MSIQNIRLEVMQLLEKKIDSFMEEFLIPVEKIWQPTDLLPDSNQENFLEEVKELREISKDLPYDFWVTLVGAYGVFFPMHFVGLAGAPRRYYDYSVYGEFDTNSYEMIMDLNVIITVFAIIAAVGQVIFLFNFLIDILELFSFHSNLLSIAPVASINCLLCSPRN